MTLETDALILRQRLKRRLVFWQVAAVTMLGLAVLVAAPRGAQVAGSHLARLSITGLIGDGREQIEDLDRLRQDSSVRGVLLHLDTPGGAVGGGEGIHDALAQLAAAKPVVAVMDGTAASAGYMIAVAAPHIVARESTLTGSIGVILELGEISGLLDKLGIKSEPLVSGPLKGQPSFTQPLSGPGREYLQGLVADLYDQFVNIVANGRHMDKAKVKQLADGRAYTGRQALGLGLIDEIGGEAQALAWMQSTRGVPAGLPVRDVVHGPWYAQFAPQGLAHILLGAAGLEPALHIDGVYALWQPSLMQN
jgi:protease-4